MPELSIIIPAYNEEKYLPFTLEKLRANLGEFAAETEVIVVNNNSTDQTAKVAEQPGVEVVFEPVNQIGRARNTGARQARAGWLLFLDADSWPGEGLMPAVFDLIRKKNHCLVTGRLAIPRFNLHALPTIWLTNLIIRFLELAPGGFLACPRQAFLEVGGFDEKYFVGEEFALSNKLKAWGRKQNSDGFKLIRDYEFITSDRKFHTHSFTERLNMLFRLALNHQDFARNREECGLWYDGRR